MADEVVPAAIPEIAPAIAAPSLLATPPAADPGSAPTPTLTPEQQAIADTAAAESKTRTDALAAATTPETRKAAYDALNADEKTAAFKGLKPEDAKALGIEDPAIPVYDFAKFKAPEGMKLDAEALKPVMEQFKADRLSQDQAQKYIDIAMSREKAAAESGVKAYVDMQNKWVSEIKADPEIGGSKLEASLASAGQLIDRLAIPGLKEALNLTGAGNNPAIAKAFVRLAAMTAEDKFAPGNGAPSNANASPATVIYGDAPKGAAA